MEFGETCRELMEKLKLKVLSYNIHKGFSTGNRKFVLKRIKEAISLVHPDLVFLQEVLDHHEVHKKNVKDWPDQSQFEYLADELWPHFAYGRNAVYSHGNHGNAILSKYPFRYFENIDISTNRLESRGILHGVIEVPGRKRPFHALCLHLGLLEAERLQQVRKLCQRIESHVPHQDAFVIAGDFNDWREKVSPLLEKTLECEEAFQKTYGTHARTFPSWLPALRLDRIYYRGMTLQDAICLNGKPWSQLSDHAALMAELAMT